MAATGCNFCGKVGSQPISNVRTTFYYDCLEVKNKKSNKNENQKITVKSQSSKGNQVCTFMGGFSPSFGQLTTNAKLVRYSILNFLVRDQIFTVS